MKNLTSLLSIFIVLILSFSQALAKPEVLIEEVSVIIGDPDTTLEISGSGFDIGSPLVVTLAGMPAAVSSATGSMVIATVPTVLFPAGDYLLTVSMGSDNKKSDDYDLTIGAVGPQGLKGDKGDTGDTGPKGDKGDVGATGPKGDKGDKGDRGESGAPGVPGTSCTVAQTNGSATIECTDGTTAVVNDGEDGEQGEQGPEGPRGPIGPAGTGGVSGYEVVRVVTNLTDAWSEGQIFEYLAICPRPKKVLGGGCSAGRFTDFDVIEGQLSDTSTQSLYRCKFRARNSGAAGIPHNFIASAACADVSD